MTRYRHILPKLGPSGTAFSRMENNASSVVTRSQSRKDRYMPEKWKEWELKFIREWFEINPNPCPNLRRKWALQLTETKLLKHMSGVEGLENEYDDFDKTEWHYQYTRRMTNWFKNNRASIARRGIPLGFPACGSTSFSLATPVSADTSAIVIDSPLNPSRHPSPVNSSRSPSPDYSDDDTIPEVSYRLRPCDANSFPEAFPAKSWVVTPRNTLDDLASLAVEADERRKEHPYSQYPESVIHGAYLLLHLKYSNDKVAHLDPPDK